MQPTRETRGEQTERGWRDLDGFVGPFRSGNGPRSDPRGEFPTGPAIGERFPDVVSTTADGEPFELYRHHGQRPAIFVFYRSAVW